MAMFEAVAAVRGTAAIMSTLAAIELKNRRLVKVLMCRVA
jgi:hypothetical protein